MPEKYSIRNILLIAYNEPRYIVFFEQGDLLGIYERQLINFEKVKQIVKETFPLAEDGNVHLIAVNILDRINCNYFGGLMYKELNARYGGISNA